MIFQPNLHLVFVFLGVSTNTKEPTFVSKMLAIIIKHPSIDFTHNYSYSLGMIIFGETTCPRCGGALKYYDTVKRIVLTKGRDARVVYIRRLRCQTCQSIHRELPNFVFPHKQYESDVILGVIEKWITPDTLGFENHPCELTMCRWLDQSLELFSLADIFNLE